MRSRPGLTLNYWPKAPRPGDTVHFEATLVGFSETPIDAVELRFRGMEERANQVVSSGKGAMVVRAQHCHLDRQLTVKGMLLAAGERKVIPFRVTLPDSASPSLHSPISEISYVVDVRVDIPWWPDRTACFELPVGAKPRPLAHRAELYSNAPEGPRGTELVLELAMESVATSLGGMVRGAVAAVNASHHRVLRFEVCAVLIDAPSGVSTYGPTEVSRTGALVLAPNGPEDGHSYPFAFRLPRNLPPSFVGPLVTVKWLLEVRAVVSFGRDVVLAPEIDVCVPEGGRREEATGALRVAPLGSKRRAMIWAQVAERTGLTNHAEQETMSGRFGDVDLMLALEQRGAQLYAVATLEWPTLGLDLTVTERRWTDAFKRDVSLQEPAFDARFAVRGRDPAQVRALLKSHLRGVLLGFECVALEDAGAQLASAENGSTAEDLEPFVQKAVAAAGAVSQLLASVPAPLALSTHRDAWRAAAAKWTGVFCAGDFSIRGGTYRGETVELLTRFDEAGAPKETAARMRLRGPAPATLPPEAQRIFDSLAAECSGLRVAPDAVEAMLPTPADPLLAESLWRAQLRLVQALTTGGPRAFGES
jgi:hypothetical protein